MNGLPEYQQLFAVCVATLILRLEELQYRVTFGEAYRPPETAALYAKQGRGIVKSLHCDRLAVDLNLFRDGEYLTSTEDYRSAGMIWKALNPFARWGGDFAKPDGNHFSFEWQGRK